MAELQQNRYDQLVRRVGGIIGPGSKVGEVISELFPMIDVENLPAELYLLSGTRISFGGGTVTSIAGESPIANLFNPAGSNILVTVTDFVISTPNPPIIRWGVTGNPRGVHIQTQIVRDTREFPPEFPVANVRQGSELALAEGTNQTLNTGLTPFHFKPKNSVCVLAPGTGLELGVVEQAATIWFTFYWRERVAEESELRI